MFAAKAALVVGRPQEGSIGSTDASPRNGDLKSSEVALPGIGWRAEPLPEVVCSFSPR